jgi:hypothetical protein
MAYRSGKPKGWSSKPPKPKGYKKSTRVKGWSMRATQKGHGFKVTPEYGDPIPTAGPKPHRTSVGVVYNVFRKPRRQGYGKRRNRRKSGY